MHKTPRLRFTSDHLQPLYQATDVVMRITRKSLLISNINNGTHEIFEAHIQDTKHTQEARSSAYKQVTHTAATLALIIKAYKSCARVNLARKL
jgi:hypothetical protein